MPPKSRWVDELPGRGLAFTASESSLVQWNKAILLGGNLWQVSVGLMEETMMLFQTSQFGFSFFQGVGARGSTLTKTAHPGQEPQ